MIVRFKIRKTIDQIIYKPGDEAELETVIARHVCRCSWAEPKEGASVASPTLPTPATPPTPSMETATLPNTRETATKPKPQGKPKAPAAAKTGE